MNNHSYENELNRPFPSSLVPLYQNESKCERFETQAQGNSEMAYSYVYEILFSNGMMSTKTRFEKEAKSDLEMANYPQIFTYASHKLIKLLRFPRYLPLSLAMHPPASS